MDLKIFQVFEQAQSSVSSHKNCVKRLTDITNKSSYDDLKTITLCYDKILSCSKKEQCADRVIRFFSLFVALLEHSMQIYFMNYLLERSCCLDKGVRFRSCQSISAIFDFIASERPESEVDMKLFENMCTTLLPRLRDKCPTVRTWAVRACNILQDPGDSKDPFISEFIRLMMSDSSKDVRIAAVECVMMNPSSLAQVVERLRDVKSEVRIAVIKKLGETVEFKNLNQKQKVSFVKYALTDREAEVRSEARAVVLQWLKVYNYDVPRVLKQMGLRSHSPEAEVLAWGIIEESQKDGASPSLRSLVLEQSVIHWGPDCTFGEVGPADLLWTLSRCSYFHKNLPPAEAAERVEHLLPDTVVLCRLLEEGANIFGAMIDDVSQLHTVELTLTFLLMLSNFVDSSDVAGGLALISLCDLLLRDVKLSDDVAEALLNASNRAHSFLSRGGDTDTIGKMVELAQELWPGVSRDDDEEVSEEELHGEDLSKLRALLIIEWCVQNQTKSGGRSGSFAEAVMPLVMQSLQQTNPDLRLSALKCLGLMGVSSQTTCESHAGIVIHIANAVSEHPDIRCQAVESLTDMAMVHSDEIVGEEGIVKTLSRIIESPTDVVLRRVTAEAAAKLLFSGRIVRSPALFAQLVKVFFHPFEQSEEEVEDNAGGEVQSATKGSAAHLDQILSVFFPAFFGAGGERGKTVAVPAVAHLIADACRVVRDEVEDSLKINQMVEQMIGWCQFLPVDTAQDSADATASPQSETDIAMKSQICASVLKEMLLLSSGRPAHKFLLKELTKTLTALAPCESWLANYDMAKDVLKACNAVKKRTILDKTSSKHMDLFFKSTRKFFRSTSPPADDGDNEGRCAERSSILSLVSGLRDLLSSEQSDDEDLCGAADGDQSGDEDFEETVPESAGTRSRLSRASKVQASGRISQQLCDENAKNTQSLLPRASETDESELSPEIGVL